MAGFSTYLADAIINYTMRGQAMPGISGLYFALFTADPTDALTAGTEVSALWYSRKSTGTWSAVTTGQAYNLARVEFTPVSGAAVTVTHVGIMDAATDGHLLFSEALVEPRLLSINDVFFMDSVAGSGDFALSINGASNHLANAVLNYVLHGQAMPVVPALHFALFGSDPGVAMVAGSEVSASWYSRKPTGAWASPTNGTTYNSSRVEFPRVADAPQIITHVGVVDSETGGYLIKSRALDSPRSMRVGDIYTIDSAAGTGDFILRLL